MQACVCMCMCVYACMVYKGTDIVYMYTHIPHVDFCVIYNLILIQFLWMKTDLPDNYFCVCLLASLFACLFKTEPRVTQADLRHTV